MSSIHSPQKIDQRMTKTDEALENDISPASNYGIILGINLVNFWGLDNLPICDWFSESRGDKSAIFCNSLNIQWFFAMKMCVFVLLFDGQNYDKIW